MHSSKDMQQSSDLDIKPSTSLDSTLSSLSPSSKFSRYSPNMARRSFGKLGRTLRFYFNLKI